MTRQLTFTMPFAMPLQNKTDRMHWTAKKKLKDRCLWEIKAQLPVLTRCTTIMFERAHIRIDRYSTRRPDHDGLVGGCKYLIDCLFPPRGLHIIPDDGPDFITTEYHAVKCRLCEQKTVVTITEIEGGHS